MEKELNIAAILKDKPNAKLWSPAFGGLKLQLIREGKSFPIQVILDNGKGYEIFTEKGKLDNDRECILFPSKEMRDWEKFAWKKGDVLINSSGFQCIFKEWASDDYTKFNGCYSESRDGYEDVQNAVTMKFQKIDNNIAYGYIREIEKKLGGKFNLETLQIDKL